MNICPKGGVFSLNICKSLIERFHSKCHALLICDLSSQQRKESPAPDKSNDHGDDDGRDAGITKSLHQVNYSPILLIFVYREWISVCSVI